MAVRAQYDALLDLGDDTRVTPFALNSFRNSVLLLCRVPMMELQACGMVFRTKLTFDLERGHQLTDVLPTFLKVLPVPLLVLLVVPLVKLAVALLAP
jgi:hypothetical protein